MEDSGLVLAGCMETGSGVLRGLQQTVKPLIKETQVGSITQEETVCDQSEFLIQTLRSQITVRLQITAAH